MVADLLRRENALSQEAIVLSMSVLTFVMFALLIPGFLSPANIAALIQNVSVLGIIATGMAITIIGRGIDLSLVATAAIGVGWMIVLLNAGVPPLLTIVAAIGFCLCVGVLNGFAITYLDIPPIFTTLAMGTIVYGFGKYFLIPADVNYFGSDWKWVTDLAVARPFGIPVPVIIFALVALTAHLFLTYVTEGRFVYAAGDNPATARTTGISIRRLTLMTYMLSAITALIGGLLMALVVAGMNTRIVSSTMVYDVILVAVLGGVALSGGRGGIKSVVVGTVLIGTLLNGMTMLDLDFTTQNIIKAVTLLIALIIDSFVNPKDEQTGRQGDI